MPISTNAYLSYSLELSALLKMQNIVYAIEQCPHAFQTKQASTVMLHNGWFCECLRHKAYAAYTLT
jgi:hypothetical protein